MRFYLRKFIGFLVSSRLYFGALNWIGIPLLAIYALFMFVIPLVNSDEGWQGATAVWYRWQAMNAGMLAFLSSLVVFNISKYNAEQQRKRDFLAARSLLPEALHEITDYCKVNIDLMADFWEIIKAKFYEKRVSPYIELTVKVKYFPENYSKIFKDCISVAEPHMGRVLANIMVKMQFHNMHVRLIADNIYGDRMIIHPDNVIRAIYEIAEIQVLINRAFRYARGHGDFDNSPLTWEDFERAFDFSKLKIGMVDHLDTYIKAKIESKAEQQRPFATDMNGENK